MSWDSVDLDTERAIRDARARGDAVIIPRPHELLLDIDSPERLELFNAQFALMTRYVYAQVTGVHVSRSGNYHIIISLGSDRRRTSYQRAALQAALGSDPKRELFAMLENDICGGRINTSVLFTPPTVPAPRFPFVCPHYAGVIQGPAYAGTPHQVVPRVQELPVTANGLNGAPAPTWLQDLHQEEDTNFLRSLRPADVAPAGHLGVDWGTIPAPTFTRINPQEELRRMHDESIAELRRAVDPVSPFMTLDEAREYASNRRELATDRGPEEVVAVPATTTPPLDDDLVRRVNSSFLREDITLDAYAAALRREIEEDLRVAIQAPAGTRITPQIFEDRDRRAATEDNAIHVDVQVPHAPEFIELNLVLPSQEEETSGAEQSQNPDRPVDLPPQSDRG